MSEPSDKPRLVQLDVLRAVAVLLVFGRHAVIQPPDAGLLKNFAGVWYRLGWTGVDLFFVLSGFLIGGLLFKELRTRSQLDVGRFLIRRGLKLWPAYYVYVTVTFGVLFVYFRDDSPWLAVSTIWSNYLHMQT
jgi:peptidoglycan/LPS O-acetylase OafA/YrhL